MWWEDWWDARCEATVVAARARAADELARVAWPLTAPHAGNAPAGDLNAAMDRGAELPSRRAHRARAAVVAFTHAPLRSEVLMA